MQSAAPLISVCVPVYDTEPYLERCLRSAAEQDFDNFEIVVVSDASRGKDARGWKAKKIVKTVQKQSDKARKQKGLARVPIKFIEHSENRGLIEVRRSLCNEASGLYMTQLDSDDELEDGALSALWSAAQAVNSSGQAFDIVHGTSAAGSFDADGNFTPAEENRFGAICYEKIFGRDVFRRWLMEGAFTANTWGKLIKRSLWLEAYENIPYTECNMADDALLFFFLAQKASSYIGIQDKVYRYRLNVGMTSARKIDTMRKWRMICSTASVFTVISQWIERQRDDDDGVELLPDEVEKVRLWARGYLANNLRQYYETVVPELREEAYAELCEYWGESFVKKADAAMKAAQTRGNR